MTSMIDECPSWFRHELFSNTRSISILAILGTINAIVVLGNLLVVLAVFVSAKLRTVTNFLIVSLAISDLLVGLAVLPYSISLEILDVWVFGELWCQVWLAVDVWLCTASILNLCAISVDRYLAITRPVHYRAIMSTLKVRLMIVSVWVLSFIICFPPLVGWNDRVQDTVEEDDTIDNWSNTNATDDFMNVTLSFQNSTRTRRCPKPQCALITNPGYVIYSAMGSFYIPMLVMLFFYYRIYVVALKTSRALDRGFRTAKSGKGSDSGPGGSDVTLRIHRGRPTGEANRSGDILVPRRVPTVVYHHSEGKKEDFGGIKRSKSANYSTNSRKPEPLRSNSRQTDSQELDSHRSSVSSRQSEDASSSQDSRKPSSSRMDHLTVSNSGSSFFRRSSSKSSSHGLLAKSSSRRQSEESREDISKPSTSKMDHLTVSGDNFLGRSPSKSRGLFASKSVKTKNARWHAKRFRTEAKATKTVGIIVGGFILCWLPFFTVYLILGFCETCIPEILFKVFFYLGYCNSALNPIIYGVISKDFRTAFQKILCRCTLQDDSVASLIRHIHMPTFLEGEQTLDTSS